MASSSVAMRNFFLGIAAVEGFHPENGGGLIRPSSGCCAGRSARRRSGMRAGSGQAGHFIHHRAGRRPDFHFLGKFAIGMQIGERPMLARDQNVLAVGRGRHFVENSRLAERRHLAGRRVDATPVARSHNIRTDPRRADFGADPHKSPRRSRGRRFPAPRDLWERAVRRARALRLAGTVLTRMRFVVGQPVDGLAQHGVQLEAFDFVASCRWPDRRATARFRWAMVLVNANIFPSGDQRRAAGARLRRQRDVNFGAFRQLHQRDRVAVRQPDAARWFCGSMRMPARRSMGAETSSMPG